MKKKKSVVLSILLFSLLNIYAQNDSIRTEKLPEVKLISTRIVETQIKTPTAVSVIDLSEIQDILPQLSFNDYINTTPGLFAMNANNFSQDLRVSIRGFGARSAFGIRGIKLVVDGIPETTPDGQGQIDNLNLAAIEKLEIIRGPASALYGNASGGVINIITKDEFETNFVKPNVTFGSYGFNQYQIQLGYKLSSTKFLLNAVNTNTNGYRENSGFKNTNVNFKMKHKFSKNTKFNAQINYSDSPYAGDAGGLTLEEVKMDRRQARMRNLDYGTEEAIKQFKAGVNLDHTMANTSLNAYGFYSSRDFYGLLPFEFGGIVDLKRNYFGFGTSLNHKSQGEKSQNTIQLGIDYGKQNDARNRYLNLLGSQGDKTLDQDELFTSFGIYAINHFKFNDFLIQSSIRYDHNQIEAEDQFLSNGDQSDKIRLNSFNPSIGVSYQLTGGNYLYANFSTSFETPVLSELSANPSGEGGFNKDLKPQKSQNYEIGYKIKDQKVYGELALFYIRTTNDIIPYELEMFPDRTFYKNAGRTKRKGLELSLGLKVSSSFDMNLSYSYSDFKYDSYESSDGNFNGNELPGIPQHMGALTLFYKNDKGFRIRLNNRYVGKMYVNDENDVSEDGYISSDLNLGYSWRRNKIELIPFLGVNNLFNTLYNDNIRINAFGGRYYEPAPELNVYGGLRLLHAL